MTPIESGTLEGVTKAAAAEQRVEIIALPGVGPAGVWDRTRTCDESS